MSDYNKDSISHTDLMILSAVWVLSCNDELPQMTYRGITERLELDDENYLRQLIKSHGEMFNTDFPKDRLDKWKQEMLAGNNLTTWIYNEKDLESRKKLIESLNPKDLFRNQFRLSEASPAASLEILKWGVEHIERLRKASVENAQEKTRSIKDLLLPGIATVASIITILVTVGFQFYGLGEQQRLQAENTVTERSLKQYEVEMKPKQESYAAVMKSIKASYNSALSKDLKGLETSLNEAQSNFYQIAPFLRNSADKTLISNLQRKLDEFADECRILGNSDSKSEQGKLVTQNLEQKIKDLDQTVFSNLFQ